MSYYCSSPGVALGLEGQLLWALCSWMVMVSLAFYETGKEALGSYNATDQEKERATRMSKRSTEIRNQSGSTGNPWALRMQ